MSPKSYAEYGRAGRTESTPNICPDNKHRIQTWEYLHETRLLPITITVIIVRITKKKGTQIKERNER